MVGKSAKSVVFISRMVDLPWGASEELWSQTALRLLKNGWRVGASVHRWLPPHDRISQLMDAGISIQFRAQFDPMWRRLWGKIVPNEKSVREREVEPFLARVRPNIVIFSDGGAFPPIDLLELCSTTGVPFATISHGAGNQDVWPDDQLASRYRRAFHSARRCYFISSANRELVQKQIGCELKNTEIVQNPYNVDIGASPPFPPLKSESELRFACVARLHPPSKGQHILLEALADSKWKERRWSLRLYGDGPMREGIALLAKRFGLDDRVQFCGHVSSIESIWAENHVLVAPSRYESWLPLAMIEAMICGRPTISTDVAGHSEIIVDGKTGFLAEAATPACFGRALDRAWDQRMNFETIGRAAAACIRQYVPPDPIGIFARKIMDLVGAANE
jgi:glycosyltransferase involved in cell wall biosynthesis